MKKSRATARYTQMILFDPGNSEGIPAQVTKFSALKRAGPVEAAMRTLNIEEMTPIEALNKLHELKKLLD